MYLIISYGDNPDLLSINLLENEDDFDKICNAKYPEGDPEGDEGLLIDHPSAASLLGRLEVDGKVFTYLSFSAMFEDFKEKGIKIQGEESVNISIDDKYRL